MRMLKFLLGTLSWSIAACCSAATGAAQFAVSSAYAIVERINGPSTVVGWDYATVDSGGRRLFLSTAYPSGGGLTVLDLTSGHVGQSSLQLKTAHGIAVLDDSTAAVADAARHSVLFFEPGTGRMLAAVDTGRSTAPDGWHNPDSLLLAPGTGLLVAVNKDSGELVLVDVARHSIAGRIKVGGALEAATAGRGGTVYVNIESKGAIAAVDIPGRKVIRQIPLAGCEEPTGIQYDTLDDLLISVCGNGSARFVDPATGAELANVAVGRGADAVMYDSGRKVVFIAGGDTGELSVIRITDRRNIALVQTLVTQPGTRLGAVDSQTGKLYLPTAKPDLAAPPLHLPGLPPIAPAAAGSFQFLVVAQRP